MGLDAGLDRAWARTFPTAWWFVEAHVAAVRVLRPPYANQHADPHDDPSNSDTRHLFEKHIDMLPELD